MNSNSMANDAESAPRGKVGHTESSFISSLAHMGEAIPMLTACGDATTATSESITPACNGPLQAGEERWLARIRSDRAHGFMVSGVDVDFLLVTLRRFGV